MLPCSEALPHFGYVAEYLAGFHAIVLSRLAVFLRKKRCLFRNDSLEKARQMMCRGKHAHEYHSGCCRE